MRRSLPALLGLAVGVAGVIGAVPAGAEEGVAFKNILGNIGVVPRERDPIHYRERAPLVIPPKGSLPSPTASSASSNPQWPTDPDVASRRRREAEERMPVTWSETRRMSDNNATLSPRELSRGRSATTDVAEPGSHVGDNDRESLILGPIRQGLVAAKLMSDDNAPAAALPYKEPSRQTLAEPPSGYRKPANGKTVTANSTPVFDQERANASPMAWLTERFTKKNDDE